MINVMCLFIFVNWDTLVPWAYQLCCLPSINNTIPTANPNRGYPVQPTANPNQSYPVQPTVNPNRAFPVQPTANPNRAYPVQPTANPNRAFQVQSKSIRPLFGDFMFFISLPCLFLLPAFFTIINNFLAKFKF